LKIFVCEFISGGGLYREQLPKSLLEEGLLMRNSVLKDFYQIRESSPDNYPQILTSVDHRVLRPKTCDQILMIEENNPYQVWQESLSDVEAVLWIAPETDGVLASLTRMSEAIKNLNLGSDAKAVEMCGNKFKTYQQLESAGIPTIACYTMDDLQGDSSMGWVVKPIDGAGAVDTVYLKDKVGVDEWMIGREQSHIIQPYQPGVAGSFVMLCKAGFSRVMAANTQEIKIIDGQFQYLGGMVNGLKDHLADFEAIAEQVVDAFPGLNGYVGVDVIIDNDRIYVVEINPRLTTTYCRLHEALGLNPAKVLIDLIMHDIKTLPRLGYDQKRILVHAS
jgi:tyramine---L-glutamate ligase